MSNWQTKDANKTREIIKIRHFRLDLLNIAFIRKNLTALGFYNEFPCYSMKYESSYTRSVVNIKQ